MRALPDVGRADEAERPDWRFRDHVADAGLAVRHPGVPSDLNEIGFAEDEQHDFLPWKAGIIRRVSMARI